MGKAVTSPPEWRRRAAEGARWVLDLPSSEWPPQALYSLAANRLSPAASSYPPGMVTSAWLALGVDRGGADASSLVDRLQQDGSLATTALVGWAFLETGHPEEAERAAMFCRRFAWEQPDDVPGLLVVADADDTLAPEPVVRAHAGRQDFSAPALGALFLARRFEVVGDFDDLDAAVELHDLTVALGDDVWHPEHIELGWAAALLYRITGEQAFLATAARMADVACEAQGRDGSWGAASLTATAAAALAEMADAVESREGVDEPLAAEPSGEMGG